MSLYVPQIYDWRSDLIPASQVFVAGGLAGVGGMTLGGFSQVSPEPGGRAVLRMSFSPLARSKNLAASWTYSRVMNGGVMRVPLFCSPQLVDAALLGSALTSDGIPWSNNGPWANNQNWAYRPSAPVAAAASRGAAQFTMDISDAGEILSIGHVIGFRLGVYDFAHVVLDVTYVDDVATVSIEPPLRRALTTDDRVEFRPSMLATIQDPESFVGVFGANRVTAPGSAIFVEALV